MSRIGKKPIVIPSGVNVANASNAVTVKGPLGENKIELLENITVDINENVVNVINNKIDEKQANAFHGLIRSLIANAVEGVSTGYSRELEILGVGYRAAQQGTGIKFQLGYSHDIIFDAPDGIKLEVLEATKLKVSGFDKQQVGQASANIRKLRPPEPYKGKGIRYKGEHVRKKAGKTGK